MEVNHAYVGEGCGSLTHFATKLGYDFQQAKNMAWLGYALDGCPGLEEAVRDKRLMLAQAYEIGKVYQFPELVLEEDLVAPDRARQDPEGPPLPGAKAPGGHAPGRELHHHGGAGARGGGEGRLRRGANARDAEGPAAALELAGPHA